MIDVCLVLEGTYPYVSGGVSTWIHQLVTAMPDLRFSILYISPFPNPRRTLKYRVPQNVVDIQDVYLHEYGLTGRFSSPRRRQQAFAKLGDLHDSLFQGDCGLLKSIVPLLRDPEVGVTQDDVIYSEESWQTLMRFYERFGEKTSFLDFFWTWRSITLPLLQVVNTRLPSARLYHTVSTGYAGLLASIAKITQNRRMLLTEHGIYTHERLLEISQASWIYSPQTARFRIRRELPYFKRLWLNLFQMLGRITYHYSDRIITLYEGNRTREILDGADPDRISVIPNGINLDFYRGLERRARGNRPPTVAFIGRVVSIKDVKTFLQAAKIVLRKAPETRFRLLGPLDEEPEYVAECRQFIDTLGIKDAVEFAGKVDLKQHLPNTDVVVLTSLSEAQPFVIIEANAAGIPVVATNVGACRELLEGRLPEDRRIGASGLITDVAAPEQTARAILRLLRNPRLARSQAQAGRRRAFRFYDEVDLISQYLNLYEQNMS